MATIKVDKNKVVYIIGSITGNPDYKQHFDRAERELRELGYEMIINPTVNPVNLPYERYSYLSVGAVQASDIICVLEGWEKSKGARAEFSLAEMMGKTIIYEVCHYGKPDLGQIL